VNNGHLIAAQNMPGSDARSYFETFIRSPQQLVN